MKNYLLKGVILAFLSANSFIRLSQSMFSVISFSIDNVANLDGDIVDRILNSGSISNSSADSFAV